MVKFIRARIGQGFYLLNKTRRSLGLPQVDVKKFRLAEEKIPTEQPLKGAPDALRRGTSRMAKTRVIASLPEDKGVPPPDGFNLTLME